MLEFFVFMVAVFAFLVSTVMFAFYTYVAFDLRKRFLGEPYKPGFNLTKKRMIEEYKIADNWWRNR